jgi:signal transduction histidine kinase
MTTDSTVTRAATAASSRGARLDWIALSLCLAVAVLCIAALPLQVLQAMELRIYDIRARMVAPMIPRSPEIVIIEIDDRSLRMLEADLGRWPWPRSTIADVISYCSEARTIALDIIFPESDVSHPDGDLALAKATEAHGGIISSVYFDNQGRRDLQRRNLADYGLASASRGQESYLEHDSWIAPFPALRDASARLGHVNYVTEFDGILRRHHAVLAVGETGFPSLALAAVAHFKGVPNHDIRFEDDTLVVGAHRMLLDERGRFRFCPSSRGYTRVSIGDVLLASRQPSRAGTARQLFRDKIVFIGSTATGLQADRQVTPMGPYIPGVFSHAIAADNLLSGHSYKVPAHSLQVLFIVVICLVPGFLRVQQPRMMVTVATGLILVVLVLMFAGLYAGRLMLPTAMPIIGAIFSCTVLGVRRWNIERMRRRELEQLDAAKQLFTDMLVHDMRNQVQPILMALDLLRMTAADDDSRMITITDTARVTSKRLLGLINGLLDVRKMQEGRMQLHRQIVDPVAIVCETMHEFTVAADTARVAMDYTTPNIEPRECRIDPRLLSRMVENLIWNSIQHAPHRSLIELGCAFLDDSTFEFWIANHGQPIPVHGQEDIFEPFISGDEAAKRFAKGGTGLGLAFCRMAAASHGGSIKIESPCYDTDGVKVIVRLPIDGK